MTVQNPSSCGEGFCDVFSAQAEEMHAQAPAVPVQGNNDVGSGNTQAEDPDQALLRRAASAPDPGEAGLAAHIAGAFIAGMNAALGRQQV